MQQVETSLEPPYKETLEGDFDGFDSDDDLLLAEIKPLNEKELGVPWEERLLLAANNPDDDIALAGLKAYIIEVKERGEIGMAMRMAMELGAMACLHNHLQDVAKEIGESLLEGLDKTHNHSDNEHLSESGKHDSTTCKDCKAGKCKKGKNG